MTIQLGGNIQLSGFHDCDHATMIVVKKIVGNFVRDVDSESQVQGLHLTLTTTAHPEHKQIYELHAQLTAEKEYVARSAAPNLMIGLSSVMKKIERTMQ